MTFYQLSQVLILTIKVLSGHLSKFCHIYSFNVKLGISMSLKTDFTMFLSVLFGLELDIGLMNFCLNAAWTASRRSV